MAESKIEVKVSIEKAIHDALCAFAQQLADDHHVEIQSVQFDWASRLGRSGIVIAVDIDTRVQM